MLASFLTSSKAPTIRSRLVLLVLACVVPASLMLAARTFYDYQKDRRQLVDNSMVRARAVLSVVDRDLAGTQSALFALATSARITDGDLEAFYAQAQQVQKNLNVNNIVLIDRTFHQQVNTLQPLRRMLPVDRAPWIDAIFATGLPVTTDIFTGAVAKKPLIAVGVPVYRDNRVEYVLAAGVWPERLSDLLQKQRLPSEWIAVILDSTGTIVARTHSMEKFVGKKGGAGLLERMKVVPEGSMQTSTLEGILVETVFTKSAVSSWTVAVGIPSRVLLSELWASLWWTLAGTVFLLAASLGFAWRIAGQITRAVRGLAAPAMLLGDGTGVVVVPPLGLKEADDVGAAITRTSEMLLNAEHKALHDNLTALPNRALFHEIANKQLALCKRDGTALSVLFIDLDGFKRINDQHGHETGDRLLCAVATRLKNTIRASDTAARLGGDEFALLLVHTDIDSAGLVATKLIDSLSSPYRLGELTVVISASIGISSFPDSGPTSEQLLRHADEAMYKVKFGGKHGYSISTRTSRTANEHLN